jgi:hypothetical protein
MKFNLVKIRHGSRNVLIAITAALFLRLAWDMKLIVGDDVPLPGIWTAPSAIMSKGHYDPLPNRNCGEIGFPLSESRFWCAYTVYDHNLVYWSTSDKSVCIATPNGSRNWYSAKHWISDGTDVCSLVASNRCIYLNIRSHAGAVEALRLVPDTGHISVVSGVVEIRGHDNSSDIVGLRKDGYLQFYTDALVATSPPIFVGKVADWDGDAIAKMLCSRKGRHITTWNSGRTSGFDVDMANYRGMSLCTAKQIIWISSDTTALALTGSVLDYRYTGAYLGSHLLPGSPAGTPMYPGDPVVVNIARRLSIIGNDR